ncbi:DUF7221 family queuine tRNA-ribosyltransferase-like protein [Geminisphaera colitermitum]|uniref:deazapurine DNA modification protein DpdA family protein n=1 Tax=Geminisphaera colitermitum TaxID=1148786 RepID=UPI0012FEE3CB|nr:hypothetical protein [Geminisphaera colitermitum]
MSDCWPFARVMVSVNRLRTRKSPFRVNSWMMDSGAFTELTTHGRYRHEPEDYADQVRRWSSNGTLLAAATQDYMCEPFVLAITGKSVAEHQALTIERYVCLRELVGSVYLLPVLQGFAVPDYVSHVKQYGKLLAHGAWVGVGSVCKRNVEPGVVEDILLAIKRERPDLRLHGFGLKIEALRNPSVRELLHSSDSMAWSFDGRHSEEENASAHDPRHALRYCAQVETVLNEKQFIQPLLFEWWHNT